MKKITIELESRENVKFPVRLIINGKVLGDYPSAKEALTQVETFLERN